MIQVLFILVAFIGLVSVNALPEIFADDRKTRAISFDMVAAINAMPGMTWKAAVTTRFANATVADIKGLLGTILPGEKGYIGAEKEKTEFKTAVDAIPESFDVREAWPDCAAVSGHVRDQSNCGSCWAFATTEAFNDRLCITSGEKRLLSPEDTAACCSGPVCSMSMGCNGGQPSGAWNWFTKSGVSTGGDYADVGSGLTCKPYSLISCAHHVAPPAGMVACDSVPSYSTPKCTNTCSDAKYSTEYKSDKHFASTSYSVKTVSNIQRELMEKGSVSATLTVYEDFEAYSSGVYKHVSGKNLGGHAVKMIGWGVDNGTPYWTIANSWNPSWGENGFFRILRGSNECGIESGIDAGDV